MEDWTPREVISMHMMQALVANKSRRGEDILENTTAAQAIRLADALIAANRKASELDARRPKSE